MWRCPVEPAAPRPYRPPPPIPAPVPGVDADTLDGFDATDFERRTRLVAAAQLTAYRVVTIDADGRLVTADCGNPDHGGRVLGVIETSPRAGEAAVVVDTGLLTNPGWSWSVTAPVAAVRLGHAGDLVQMLPADAVFEQVIGQPVSATSILLSISTPPLYL